MERGGDDARTSVNMPAQAAAGAVLEQKKHARGRSKCVEEFGVEGVVQRVHHENLIRDQSVVLFLVAVNQLECEELVSGPDTGESSFHHWRFGFIVVVAPLPRKVDFRVVAFTDHREALEVSAAVFEATQCGPAAIGRR
jgi:hypothetical protein